MTAPAIRAEHLSKCYQLYDRPVDRLKQLLWGQRRRYYREFWALRDASFEVAKGEVLGIVGRNGAGKSTLLQMVCGTLAPTSGTLAVEGRIAALLELGAGFNPDFTGRENVILSASVLGLSKSDIDARFEEIVDFSGIRDFIDQPVKFYSSGMYMRLAFAVATSVDPDILVVDEALSVGDGEFARKSFDRIMLLKKAGATILFCSHSLYQVEAFCDRVLWLEHGRTVMLGRPQEVVQRYTQSLASSDAPRPQVEAAAVQPGTVAETPPAPPGYARLTRLEVAVDGEPGRELRIRTGANALSVRMQFDSDPGLPGPVVGVTLDYGTLITVACTVSRSDGVAIERDEAGRGSVTLTFPALALRKGDYRVGVYLGCENALHIYDSVPHCATISVDDDRPEPGLVDVPHHWSTRAGIREPSADAPRRALLADGRALWVDAGDSLGLAARGVFEPAETTLCAALLCPGDRVLDVGANLGYYTTLFAQSVGATGRIDAIEPDPDNYALLDANTRTLQDAGRVRLHRLALSDSQGTALLFRSKDNVGMHRLYESVCCTGRGIDVATCRGDDLALSPLDFIKIDVEGYEPVVMRGLEATLQASPRVAILSEYAPLSILEAGGDPGEWLAWMKRLGFHLLAHDGSRWSVAAGAEVETQAAALAQFDIHALKRTLRDADNAHITTAATTALETRGYTRPLVENVLFVRDVNVVLQRLEAAGRQEQAAAAAPAREPKRWDIDWVRAEHEPELLDLFHTVFGYRLSPTHWRWKYGEAGVGVIVTRGGRIVAFYGGMPRRILAFGSPDTAVQIGDVMVDPAERGVLTRKGPFFLATSTFLNAKIGVGKPYRYGYGFPHERAMKVAERLGLYAAVDELLEAVWQPLPASRSLALRARPLTASQLHVIDRLWTDMARDAGEVVIGVRDAAHVQRRFLQHPATSYLCLLVTTRWLRKPVGFVVLRDRGADGMELVDAVAPKSAIAALVLTARRAAARAGRGRLFAWMTPGAAAWFAASGPQITPTGYVIPASALDVPDNALQVRGKWWLVGGDTDFR